MARASAPPVSRSPSRGHKGQRLAPAPRRGRSRGGRRGSASKRGRPSVAKHRGLLRRHPRLVLAVGCALLVSLLARLFVFPATDVLEGADAVVVFPASGEQGLREGLALVNARAAPILVILGGSNQPGASADGLCRGRGEVEVLCPPAETDTGQQVRVMAALAGQRGWTRVAVISSRDTLSRAALLANRCTDATVLRRAAPTPQGASLVLAGVREAPRYLRALLSTSDC